MEVVQAGVAASRVGQVVPARSKRLQAVLHKRASRFQGQHHLTRANTATNLAVNQNPNAITLVEGRFVSIAAC